MQATHLLTTAEVAGRLHCSLSTVVRLVKAGKLRPAVKAPGIRGAMLFDPEHVDEYLGIGAAP